MANVETLLEEEVPVEAPKAEKKAKQETQDIHNSDVLPKGYVLQKGERIVKNRFGIEKVVTKEGFNTMRARGELYEMQDFEEESESDKE